jgi:hypothetical protein
METVNVGSSFMHDDITIETYEEYEDIDEEGEGLIESRPSGRTANYTIAMDDPNTCARLTREVILRSPAMAPEKRLLLGDNARKYAVTCSCCGSRRPCAWCLTSPLGTPRGRYDECSG